jgi:hypothetical protein
MNFETAVELNRRKQREQRGKEFGWIEFAGGSTLGAYLVGQDILMHLHVSPFPPVESNCRFRLNSRRFRRERLQADKTKTRTKKEQIV